MWQARRTFGLAREGEEEPPARIREVAGGDMGRETALKVMEELNLVKAQQEAKLERLRKRLCVPLNNGKRDAKVEHAMLLALAALCVTGFRVVSKARRPTHWTTALQLEFAEDVRKLLPTTKNDIAKACAIIMAGAEGANARYRRYLAHAGRGSATSRLRNLANRYTRISKNEAELLAMKVVEERQGAPGGTIGDARLLSEAHYLLGYGEGLDFESKVWNVFRKKFRAE